MKSIFNFGLIASSAALFHKVFYKSARDKLINKGGQTELVKSLVTSGISLSTIILIKVARRTNSVILKLSILTLILITLKRLLDILSTLSDIDGKVELKYNYKNDNYDSQILFNEYQTIYNLRGQYSTFEKLLNGLNLSRIESKLIWSAKASNGEYLLKPIIKLLALTKEMKNKSNQELNTFVNTYFILSNNSPINLKSDNISKSNSEKRPSIADKKLNAILEKARL